MGLVLTGLVAPGAWADAGNVERRVHRPTIVSPRATSSPTGLTPAQVKQAYIFPTDSNAGAGRTIAIVVPFDDPAIESDLNAFSKRFGLPACTTQNGCFKKVDQRGGKKYPAPNKLWAMETALDVEWAHAIAPGANILLVEAKSDGLTDVLVAEDYATAHAGYVSNSLGLGEFAGQSVHNSHFDRPGVSIFVASGDDGAAAGPGYPAAAPGVISVGGTTLFDIGKPTFREQAWRGSGGGCSLYEPAHPAQSAFAGYPAMNCAGKRATPDVALVADPRSGVSVYNSFQTSKSWAMLGGTSAATPMWAARAAASGLVVDANLVYGPSSAISFRDITVGSNGLPALPGLDLATGRGSWTGPTP
ncbi:MAG TPA: S53 family peptidase [Acidimicrobiia bacterium]|nr:S53 family peptidase [Acidimicrobiia bacterium]